jgi:chromosome segregation ATPase
MTTSPARQHLAASIGSLTEAETNLARLRSALERASAELAQLDSQLIDARAAQAQAGRESQRSRALAYADTGEVAEQDVPEAAAAAVLDSLTSLHQKRTEIAADLQKEIVAVQRRVEVLKRQVSAQVAQVIESSEEFAALQASFGQAWERLRTVRIALEAVLHLTAGNIGQESYRLLNTSEPLHRDLVGYPWDTKLVTSWEAAVARLATDPDAKLPSS